MSDRSPARSILGGAAVVVLSGAAAFVGAGLSRRESAPAPPPAAPADAATLESIDRRIGYLEKRVELVEQMSRTALELSRSLEDHGRTARAAGGESAPAVPAPDTRRPRTPDSVEPPVPEPDRNDGADGQMAKVREISHQTTRNRVVYAMTLMTDATEEGIANRQIQATADARAMAHFYNLSDDAQAEVRKILQDQWDRGARDIGPMVHDGLEKSDVASVRERLNALYAETDRRLRPLFDDEKWKKYEAAAAGLRGAESGILDEYEKARLSGK